MANTDYFTYVGSPGTATTLAAPGHTIGGTAITVDGTANWPTTSGVIFAIDTVSMVNGELVRDAGSYTEWQGDVTGGTDIANMVLRYGSDQNYPAGSTTRVYIPVASSRENRIVDGLLLNIFDQDATMKAGAVDNAAALASNVVTTAKINDGAVTNDKLADNTIGAGKISNSAITLGYAQSTSNFTLSSSQTTPTQVTGLSATVSIPTGSRKIKITAYCGALQPTAPGVAILSIWDGAVNSGTQITSANNSTNNVGVTAIAVVTPSAGSKTYNVGIACSTSNNVTVGASTTQPAFILVEAI